MLARKNILVTGRAVPLQPDRCTGQQLVQGFREAGHNSYFYGCFYQQPFNFIGHKELQDISHWDLVIVTEMNDGMPGYERLFQYYKVKDVPRLYWDFDISYNEVSAWQRAGTVSYDGYLVGNKLFIDQFANKFNKPSLHLPYACSPTIHNRKPDVHKEHIVGFVGNITPERKPLLDIVHCVNGVFGDDMIKATNSLHTMVHINQSACKGLVPGRPWETSGCGTNLLMDRASYEDFREFITPELDGTAVSVFDSLDDIIRYKAACKDNLDKLSLYGEKLMHYMHSNHSYRNRANQILDWMTQQKLL
jgi:hypothetical protein